MFSEIICSDIKIQELAKLLCYQLFTESNNIRIFLPRFIEIMRNYLKPENLHLVLEHLGKTIENYKVQTL